MISRVDRELWKTMSENAHVVVFCEKRPSEMDRIDFVLIQGEEGTPQSFATVRELDSESVYLQHGGCFPGTKGKAMAAEHLRRFCTHLFAEGYKRICFLVENTNVPMVKIALQNAFLVTGLRVFKTQIMLEMSCERTTEVN